MKLRHPGLIGLVALLAAWLVRVWLGTVRYRVVFLGGGQHPTNPRNEPFIYAFWHEALLFPTEFRTRIHILISQHADGELIARVCRHLGFKVVRGSTTRGGGAALLEMAALKGTHLAITPDGPRGPRRRLQVGAIILASFTGLPVVPIGVACTQAWRAPSWDRMLLPWPWATVIGITGRPIPVPAGLGRDRLEEYRLLVEAEMARLTLAAERWALEGVKPTAASLEIPPPLRHCA